MKVFIVEWTDSVSREVRIMADSPEEALENFKEGQGYQWKEVAEVDSHTLEEPTAIEEED